MSESGMLLAKLWNDESGVSAVEYVLLLALVGSAVIAGSILLGDAIMGELSETATCIQSEGTACT